MKLPRTAKGDPEINLTSLIDVVFLLLIFFMVTTTFVPEAGLRLELPEASTESATATDEPLEVVVDAADRAYLDGRPLGAEPDALRAALSAAVDDAGGGLRIRADGRASHQAVVAVMDAAAAVGFERVDIVTRQPERAR